MYPEHERPPPIGCFFYKISTWSGEIVNIFQNVKELYSFNWPSEKNGNEILTILASESSKMNSSAPSYDSFCFQDHDYPWLTMDIHE